jgi:hypothetical protein
MRMAFLVAVVIVLAAAAAWALSNSEPANAAYTVEVSDVASVRGLVVSPEVVAAVPGSLAMAEVVVRANQMPEVVVCGAPDEVGSQMSEARGRKFGKPSREEV